MGPEAGPTATEALSLRPTIERFPRPEVPLRRSALTLACSLGALAGVGCASTGPADPYAPPVCIDIDNEEGGGRMERIFLVGNNNGLRLPIGDAPAGRVTSWCSRRVSVPGVYYLLIERPGSDTIDPATGQTQARAFRTVDFAIDRGDRWIYEVRRDRLLCVPAGGDC